MLIGSNGKISFKISSVNITVGFAIFLQEDMERKKDLQKMTRDLEKESQRKTERTV